MAFRRFVAYFAMAEACADELSSKRRLESKRGAGIRGDISEARIMKPDIGIIASA